MLVFFPADQGLSFLFEKNKGYSALSLFAIHVSNPAIKQTSGGPVELREMYEWCGEFLYAVQYYLTI